MVAAWSLHNQKPVPNSLRFITQAFDLLDGDDVAELGKVIQAAGGAGGLVILDTLNRAAPGADENSSVDMGNGHPCIRLDEAVSLVAERMVCKGKHKSSRAKEAVNGLVARDIYGVKGEWLWRI